MSVKASEFNMNTYIHTQSAQGSMIGANDEKSMQDLDFSVKSSSNRARLKSSKSGAISTPTTNYNVAGK